MEQKTKKGTIKTVNYSKCCKSCYKIRYSDYRRERRKLEEETKPRLYSKYEKFKPYKPSNNRVEIWNKPMNNMVLCILQCRNCNKLLNQYTFIKKYNFYKCPKCGANLIYWGGINFLNANPVYLHRSIKNNSLFSYDQYK